MENITLTEELIISAENRAEGQAYPYLIKNLKAIGIDNYFVKVSNHKRTYTATNGEKLIIPPDMPEFEPAETFELEAVKAAIKKIQEKSIDYHTFLKEIGDAGIHTYVADITGMKVIYQGPNSEYEYEEIIPEV
ncbi:DUF1398 family protein [Dyadobacter psychrotolerans]|uniref:DUF1398 domain-containing protein n=1 Tax=Dyadobacter psychrotolerans TaxID=2541721 RepID=A0A4R5DVS9_9BACT|nr:DUF1398 family protein [Dyadobacter psychrotolerans]TDE18676.1 DUF1398 domain-containing protein [Dyadobacter psychrotolerans]